MPVIDFIAFWFEGLMKVFRWNSLTRAEKLRLVLLWSGVIAVVGLAVWLIAPGDGAGN